MLRLGVNSKSAPPQGVYLVHAFRRNRTTSVVAPQLDTFNEFSFRKQSYADPKIDLLKKISSREVGRPLKRDWYVSEDIFQADIKYLWQKCWLFAGYECQIRSPGDYFTYQVGNENVIIIRGDDNQIRAFYNVCRHRGSRLCTSQEGKVKNITCAYHAWTYNKSGKLIKAQHMEGQINFENYGLIPCNLRTVEGLIFVNFSENPIYPFEPAAEIFQPQLKHHNLVDAKIAYSRTDIVKANWKLVYENNRECYHCANTHPDYIKANYDLMFSYIPLPEGGFTRIVDPNHHQKEETMKHIEDCSKRWGKYGLECASHNNFPGDGWYRASRMPLRKGWVTESLDGNPVAPIMGDFTPEDRDMGSMRIHTLPNFWIHISGDHGVATRLTPVDPLHTKADQVWLVHKDAQEGVDYKLEKMLPFWGRTNAADWEICELNQAGILSEKYNPSPYSLKKESGVETFIRWYLVAISKGIEGSK